MSTPSISSNYAAQNPYKANMVNDFKQGKSDFQVLGSAIQSGDLAGAQAAFAALNQDVAAYQQDRTAAGLSPYLSDSQRQDALKSMSSFAADLQSGDISAAQDTYAQLQQSVQAQKAAISEKLGNALPQTPAGAGADTTPPVSQPIDLTA